MEYSDTKGRCLLLRSLAALGGLCQACMQFMQLRAKLQRPPTNNFIATPAITYLQHPAAAGPEPYETQCPAAGTACPSLERQAPGYLPSSEEPAKCRSLQPGRLDTHVVRACIYRAAAAGGDSREHVKAEQYLLPPRL